MPTALSGNFPIFLVAFINFTKFSEQQCHSKQKIDIFVNLFLSLDAD